MNISKKIEIKKMERQKLRFEIKYASYFDLTMIDITDKEVELENIKKELEYLHRIKRKNELLNEYRKKNC